MFRIVVCPRCQGTGTLEMATGDEDRCKTIFCPLCNGMRVLKRTVTIEYNVVNNAHESEKEYPVPGTGEDRLRGKRWKTDPEAVKNTIRQDGPGKVKYSGRTSALCYMFGERITCSFGSSGSYYSCRSVFRFLG